MLKLTNNAVDDENPQISGNNVVWERDGQVYLSKNAGQPIQLDNSAFFSDALPQISGNNLAWMTNYSFFDSFLGVLYFIWDISFYDGNTSITIPQPSSGSFADFTNALNPQISGNNVVWEAIRAGEHWEIYLYNGNTTIQLTNNNFDDNSPQISGNNVVWQGNGEIYLYNGSSTIRLTNNTINDEKPQISGNNVV